MTSTLFLKGSERFYASAQAKREAEKQKSSGFLLIERANAVSVFDVLRDHFDYHLPRDGESYKSRCPFGDEHEDGGMDKGWRTYPATNSSYCVDGETEILTSRGWLSSEEVRPGDQTLSLSPESGLSSWEPVLEVFRLPAQPRRMLSIETGSVSALTTEDHRWLVEHHGAERKFRWTTSAQGFAASDRIPLPRPCVTLLTEAKYDDAFVELVAWFFTEGSWVKSGGKDKIALIHQSHTANLPYVDRIRACLTNLFGPAGKAIPRGSRPAWKEAVRGERMTTFTLNIPASEGLLRVAPNRVVGADFVTSLTRSQLNLFLETAIDGDGARHPSKAWTQLCQKEKSRLDAVQLAASLAGRPTHVWYRSRDKDWACQFLSRNASRPYRRPSEGSQRPVWEIHEGPVWCVRTPSGSWTARRRGTVYVTGNCFPMHGYMPPVRLIAIKYNERPIKAAQRILAFYDLLRPKSYRHRMADLLREREAREEQKVLGNPQYAVEALNIALDQMPSYSRRQFDPDVMDAMERVLGVLDAVLVKGDPEVLNEWYTKARSVMTEIVESRVRE